MHRAGVLPGVPTLYVDHHRPEGEPRRTAAVVLAYGWDPIPASAWLAYELLSPLVDVADLEWIAAVGTISDLGEKAPWDALPAHPQAWSGKWLREAVSLVNAARRASAFDVATPLRMLMEADGPARHRGGRRAGRGPPARVPRGGAGGAGDRAQAGADLFRGPAVGAGPASTAAARSTR